jgi:hypothetical protein
MVGSVTSPYTREEENGEFSFLQITYEENRPQIEIGLQVSY